MGSGHPLQRPPNAIFGGNNERDEPCLYTSGSFVDGGGWVNPQFHSETSGYGTPQGLSTSTSPAASYIGASYVDTLGDGR